MEAATATTSAPATSLRTAEPAAAQPTNTNYAVSPTAEAVTPSNAPLNIKVSNTTTDSSDWMGGFNEELKGYVQAKGFKDPASVVDSYKGLEKLLGAPKDRLLKLPEKEDASEWGDIYNKLGRPQTPKDYKFETVEGVDPKLGEWAKENFHKLGLSQKQGEALLKSYKELETVETTSQLEQKQYAIKNDMESLKKEWGAAFEQNSMIVDKAAQQFGFDEEKLVKLREVFGAKEGMKSLHDLGKRIGESSFVGPNSPTGFGNVMTPEQARFEIKELMSDKAFIQKFALGV